MKENTTRERGRDLKVGMEMEKEVEVEI